MLAFNIFGYAGGVYIPGQFMQICIDHYGYTEIEGLKLCWRVVVWTGCLAVVFMGMSWMSARADRKSRQRPVNTPPVVETSPSSGDKKDDKRKKPHPSKQQHVIVETDGSIATLSGKKVLC
jgi:hypothetical protein